MNNVLARRICQLIAQTYAVPLEDVLSLFLTTNSIDKTIEKIIELSSHSSF